MEKQARESKGNVRAYCLLVHHPKPAVVWVSVKIGGCIVENCSRRHMRVRARDFLKCSQQTGELLQRPFSRTGGFRIFCRQPEGAAWIQPYTVHSSLTIGRRKGWSGGSIVDQTKINCDDQQEKESSMI